MEFLKTDFEQYASEIRDADPQHRPEVSEKAETRMEDEALSYFRGRISAFNNFRTEQNALALVKALRLVKGIAEDFQNLSGCEELTEKYTDAIADYISEKIWNIWNAQINHAYECEFKGDYPSNEEWETYMAGSGFCQVIIEDCIRLTGDRASAQNITRYEHLTRLHDLCINSCGWIKNMTGSNVNRTQTFARSWHPDKKLDDHEIKIRQQRIDSYNKKMSEMRKKVSRKAIKAEKQKQEAWFREHPEEYRKFLEVQEKQNTENRKHILAGERLLEEGKSKKEAALEFIKGKDFQRARELFDFRTLIGAGQSHTVGITSDGRVLYAGDGLDGRGSPMGVTDVKKWKNIVAVDAGNMSTVALTADGTVRSCGYNMYNQLNLAPFRDIQSFCCGNHTTFGVRKSGRVVSAGDNRQKQRNVQKWFDVASVSAGVYHTIALHWDGTVSAAGAINNGRCDTKAWSDIVMIAAGGAHSVGLKADGTVVACGQNDEGQCNVEGWHDIVSIAAGTMHTIGICADGTVVACGLNDRGQCNVMKFRNVIAAACSNSHTVLLCADGTVVCAGDNHHKQLMTSGWNLFSGTGRSTSEITDKVRKKTVNNINREIRELQDYLDTLGRFSPRRHAVKSRISDLEKKIVAME